VIILDDALDWIYLLLSVFCSIYAVIAVDSLFGISCVDKFNKKFDKPLSHSIDKPSWEQTQLLSIFDDVKIFKLGRLAEEILQVDQHIHSTVMCVGLPG